MKTKLIAELCQNHNGDPGLILEMVAAAKESGAEYVKLQTIHSSQLSYRVRFDQGLIEGGIEKVIKRPYKDEFIRLSKLDINDKTVEDFLKACEKYKVKPMTTIFTRDVVKKTFDQERHSNINEIRNIIDFFSNNELKIHLGGVSMIADDTITFVKNDIMIFGIGALLFILLVLFIIFKNPLWMFQTV